MGGHAGRHREATRMAGPWKLAFVVTLLAILLPRSTLAETEDTESLYTESTPPLPPVEEEEEEVPIPYTSSLGLFEEDIVWKGFINTDPIDDEKILDTPTMEQDDSESYEKEDGMEYKGVVYTIHPKP